MKRFFAYIRRYGLTAYRVYPTISVSTHHTLFSIRSTRDFPKSHFQIVYQSSDYDMHLFYRYDRIEHSIRQNISCSDIMILWYWL